MSNETTFDVGFGAIDSPADIRDYKAICSASPEDFPKEFELDMPPVKYQGMVGSCVAHALSTVVEYFNKQQEGTDITMSTGYIYGNRLNTLDYRQGMITRYAIANLQKYGDVPNELFPRNIEVPDAISEFEEQAFVLSPDAFPNRITAYYKLDTEAAMKKQLMTTGPIVMTGYWSGKEKVDKDGVIYQPYGVTATTGHCTVIYGWNNLGWKVQNSWGDSWGKGGRCIVKYTFPFREVWGVRDELYEGGKTQRIAELESLVNKLQSQLADKEVELTELESYYNELTELYEQQAETLHTLGVNPNAIAEAQIAINAFAKQCEDLETELAIKQADLENVEEMSKRAQKELNKQIKIITENLAAVTAERDSFIAQLEEFTNSTNIKIVEFSILYAESTQQLQILTQEKAEIEARYKVLVERNTEYEAVIKDLRDQVLEIKKPFANWPKWIVTMINVIIAFFKKSETTVRI